MMDTDRLIHTLVADSAHRERPVGLVLALALLVAAPFSLVMFFIELGVRPDAMTAMRNPFFDLKFLVTLALALPAIAIAIHLSRPEALTRRWAWLLLIPLGLLGIGIASENGAAANSASARTSPTGRSRCALSAASV